MFEEGFVSAPRPQFTWRRKFCEKSEDDIWSRTSITILSSMCWSCSSVSRNSEHISWTNLNLVASFASFASVLVGWRRNCSAALNNSSLPTLFNPTILFSNRVSGM